MKMNKQKPPRPSATPPSKKEGTTKIKIEEPLVLPFFQGEVDPARSGRRRRGQQIMNCL